MAPAIGSGSAVAWSKDMKRIRKRQAKQKGKARGKKWPILNSREEKQEHLFGIDRTREKET